MTKITILSGHPRANSFTHALASAYQDGAIAAGHESKLFSLSNIELTASPLAQAPSKANWTSDIEQLWNALLWADHVVIAHPLWWGSMPGDLKTLFDQILVSGSAYEYEAGKLLPTGLLAGRSAEVIMTSDTPDWYYKIAHGSAQTKLMKNQILKFVGLNPITFTHISPVRTMDQKQRNQKLSSIRNAAMQLPKNKQKSAA